MNDDLTARELTARELTALVTLLDAVANEHSYPLGWQRWFASRADELRGEQAQRRIEAAVENDPVGFYWFGKL